MKKILLLLCLLYLPLVVILKMASEASKETTIDQATGRLYYEAPLHVPTQNPTAEKE